MKGSGFALNNMSYNGMITLLLKSIFQIESMDVYKKMISEELYPT